jgi:rSAM/selenodomain-associated transferase 2
MQLSIIIPTLNEAENIKKLIPFLQQNGGNALLEIIIADGGSTDNTLKIAQQSGAIVLNTPKGRAIQMNIGASIAKGAVLYFVHADAFPPNSYGDDILQEIVQGREVGCYRMKFISDKKLLAINSWFTRLPFLWCRGGDQTLFIKKDLFDTLGGYKNEYVIMEEYDLIQRIRHAKIPFVILPKNVLISARKYETNAWLRVQFANFAVFNMYRLGFAQSTLAKIYKQLLDYR